MREYLFFLLIAVLLPACAADNSRQNESTQTAAREAAAKPAAAPASQPETQPQTGTRQAVQPRQSEQALTLQAQDVTAKAGGKTCMEVKAFDFENLLSMQYSIRWDAELLRFTAVNMFGLPYMDFQNFGAHRTGEGILTVVWIDQSLRGTTIPDNSTAFRVCFDVVGKAGQTANFRFTGEPTQIEVVNLNEEIQPLKGVDGKIFIQ